MRELPITGYVDHFSARPGGRIRVHVSVCDGCTYRVRLVRVLSADANPVGPGVRFEDHSKYLNELREGRWHTIRLGSYHDAPGPALGTAVSHTWTALVYPTLLSDGSRVVLSHESSHARLTISMTQSGLRAEVVSRGVEQSFEIRRHFPTHRWYRVWVSYDGVSRALLVGGQPLGRNDDLVSLQRFFVPDVDLPSGGRFLVGARNGDHPLDHFDGKLEDPALLDGAYDRWPDPLTPLPQFGSRLRAGWDFSKGIATQSTIDLGPSRLHGSLKNIPVRAVRGARWSGREMRWSDRPSEYGAIHFHSDDLGDCGWPVDFEFTIPEELRSGSYAFHLSCASGEDWVPFYVLPRREGPHARIAFLAPTFTYQAYANHERGNYDELLRARVKAWSAYPFDPKDYPIYGTSTYNKHLDGSGVVFSSRLRPILSMRPAFITIRDPFGSGLRHYPADAQLLAWLESRNIRFDVVTDEDLHNEGIALLRPYAAVLTGTHPEYHTAQTLDALSNYTGSGGRLMYLGGNGFYWRIGLSGDLPGVLEVRRAEGGVRSWAAEPGEYYHASDGAYGGLWRRNGRNPQALVGVGFSAQGLFEGTYYRRTAQSYEPRFAWIFEGVDEEILGEYGLSGGGAAGYEVDRADVALGTPHEAVVLARSERLPSCFYPAMEEMLLPSVTVSGEPAENLLRADMLYFEQSNGGCVFSVGSITFCGSLWRNGFEGPVCRLLENVVRRLGSIESDEGTGAQSSWKQGAVADCMR